MVTGLATPKGYPVGVWNTMENLNYQQQLTSIPARFGHSGEYYSPLFQNQFGFSKKRFEVFSSKNNKKLRIGRKTYYPGDKIRFESDVYTIKNIGPKVIILSEGRNNSRRLTHSQFFNKMY
jgi:hypothetical protein